MTEPDPFFHKTLIWAKDTASGTYYEVTGSFDTSGNFVLNTNGTGSGGTSGGGTGTAIQGLFNGYIPILT